jgi:hypothetical protein
MPAKIPVSDASSLSVWIEMLPVGNKRFKRLDMSRSAIRDKVLKAMTNDEINHIFDIDGVF